MEKVCTGGSVQNFGRYWVGRFQYPQHWDILALEFPQYTKNPSSVLAEFFILTFSTDLSHNDRALGHLKVLSELEVNLILTQTTISRWTANHYNVPLRLSLDWDIAIMRQTSPSQGLLYDALGQGGMPSSGR